MRHPPRPRKTTSRRAKPLPKSLQALSVPLAVGIVVLLLALLRALTAFRALAPSGNPAPSASDTPPSRNFSSHPLFAQSYPTYPHHLLRASLSAHLTSLRAAAPSLPLPHPVNVTSGHSLERLLVAHGYNLIDSPVNPFCFPTPTPHPLPPTWHIADPFCVSTVPHALLTHDGVALRPASAETFELSGGPSQLRWPLLLHRQVQLPKPPGGSGFSTAVVDNPVVVLAQHIGASYFHVMTEVVPRYMLMLPLLDAVPEVRVSFSETVGSSLVRDTLALLGLEEHRMLPLPPPPGWNDVFRSRYSKMTTWISAPLLLFPPPFYNSGFSIPHNGQAPRVVAGIIREALRLSNQTVGGARSWTGTGTGTGTGAGTGEEGKVHHKGTEKKPMVLLMERARKRDAVSGACKEERCVRNFAELEGRLRAAMGRRGGEVVVFRVGNDLGSTVDMFERADVVVGVHGAGFQNVMFCREGVTLVHIGWDEFFRSMSEGIGMRFHQVTVRRMKRETTNMVLDVDLVVGAVEKAVDADGVFEERKREKVS